jgi:hypothetical protein
MLFIVLLGAPQSAYPSYIYFAAAEPPESPTPESARCYRFDVPSLEYQQDKLLRKYSGKILESIIHQHAQGGVALEVTLIGNNTSRSKLLYFTDPNACDAVQKSLNDKLTERSVKPSHAESVDSDLVDGIYFQPNKSVGSRPSTSSNKAIFDIASKQKKLQQEKEQSIKNANQMVATAESIRENLKPIIVDAFNDMEHGGVQFDDPTSIIERLQKMDQGYFHVVISKPALTEKVIGFIRVNIAYEDFVVGSFSLHDSKGLITVSSPLWESKDACTFKIKLTHMKPVYNGFKSEDEYHQYSCVDIEDNSKRQEIKGRIISYTNKVITEYLSK